MNSLTKRLMEAIRGRVQTTTPTNTNLNNSPRFIDINKPRTAEFSGANVNANVYGKKEGGEVLAKGNKLARMQKTKLY